MSFLPRLINVLSIFVFFQGKTEGQSGVTQTLTRNILALSDPDVRPNADGAGVQMTVVLLLTGAEKVVRTFYELNLIQNFIRIPKLAGIYMLMIFIKPVTS